MRDKSGISPEASGSLLLVRRLVRDFMRRHARAIALAFVCMGLAAGSTALRAWLMEPVLDRIFFAREASLLALLGGAALVLALVKGMADYGQTVLMNRVGQRVIVDVQTASFARLIHADLAYFNATSSGMLISRLINDVSLLRNAAANVLAGIGRDAVTVVFLVGLMFYQDWLLALIAFFAFPLAIRPIIGIGRRMRRVSANTQIEMGQLTTLLSQTFQGARHVKAYGMEEYEERRAGRLIERVFALVDRANRTRARATPMMEALGGAAIAVVILYGGGQVISGARTPGAFFSFITALLLAYQPIKALAILNANLQEGLAAAQRVFQVLDIEPAIRDVPAARPLRVSAGEVRFEEVRFGYHPATIALDGISLTVPGGGTVALVAQEVSLFDDTVRANIAYGRFGASQSDIEAAAAAAGADHFIRELPERYDTVVGEHGMLLSGGQRQRLAIARAMLRDAPILLLDEATSALDGESERQVQTALRSLMKGRTTIVIAHRLSTVIGADLICVLDRGRIVETGRHAQLLSRNGLYARLYETQFAGEHDLPATAGAAAAAG